MARSDIQITTLVSEISCVVDHATKFNHFLCWKLSIPNYVQYTRVSHYFVCVD